LEFSWVRRRAKESQLAHRGKRTRKLKRLAKRFLLVEPTDNEVVRPHTLLSNSRTSQSSRYIVLTEFVTRQPVFPVYSHGDGSEPPRPPLKHGALKTTPTGPIEIVWILVCAALKNILDLCLSGLIFWDDTAIVKTIAAMAHTLKLNVTAEGVETTEQLEFLGSLGCDNAYD
jgi:hypothetical protein